VKLKNKKPMPVDVLFKAYPMIPKVWPASDIVPLRLLLVVHGIWGNAEKVWKRVLLFVGNSTIKA
jgi:hypothetical protein